MSSLACFCGLGRGEPRAAAIESMLDAMRTRGNSVRDKWLEDDVAIGVGRFDWEVAGAAPPGITRRGQTFAACDASLYYRDDLLRAIARKGIHISGSGNSQLILAAYEAFGVELVHHLEGDYSFVLWDQRARRLIAARDFAGKRPLFFGESEKALVIASTIAGVLAHGSVRIDLNLATICETAAGLWGSSSETWHSAVSELQAGHILTWEPGKRATVSRYWRPPDYTSQVTDAPDAAAEQLLDLLVRATDERMSTGARTAVSLSGGWDSSSVFAAGQLAVRRTQNPARSLYPVSISYPPGDSGREDELIAEIAGHWNSEVDWLDINSIPMFAGTLQAAGEREEPWAHPFEMWNRALARRARASGAQVMLDGVGGDSLFQVSDIYLADILRQGRLLETVAQWRARGGRGLRHFVRWAVMPLIPRPVLQLRARLHGVNRVASYFDRSPATWFRRDFLGQAAITEREARNSPPLPRSGAVLREAHAFLLYPAFQRISRRLASLALSEGVELRSPLLDERVVRFAVPRPWHDRVNGAESKLLLRKAMQGLVPETVLAPRDRRTGTASDYFRRSLISDAGTRRVSDALRTPLLAELGIIEPERLALSWERFIASGDEDLGLRIFFTVETEHWLRSKAGLASAEELQPE